MYTCGCFLRKWTMVTFDFRRTKKEEICKKKVEKENKKGQGPPTHTMLEDNSKPLYSSLPCVPQIRKNATKSRKRLESKMS